MLRHTILFSTLLLLVYVSLQSCKVSKTSKKETFDSTYLKKLEQSEIENKKAITYLENLIREMEQTGVTFDTDCDTTIVQQLVRKGYDSSTVAKLFKVLAEKTNKIEVLTDGTVRAEGRIRSYTKLIEKIDSSKKVLVLEIQKLKAMDEIIEIFCRNLKNTPKDYILYAFKLNSFKVLETYQFLIKNNFVSYPQTGINLYYLLNQNNKLKHLY